MFQATREPKKDHSFMRSAEKLKEEQHLYKSGEGSPIKKLTEDIHKPHLNDLCYNLPQIKDKV